VRNITANNIHLREIEKQSNMAGQDDFRSDALWLAGAWRVSRERRESSSYRYVAAGMSKVKAMRRNNVIWLME